MKTFRKDFFKYTGAGGQPGLNSMWLLLANTNTDSFEHLLWDLQRGDFQVSILFWSNPFHCYLKKILKLVFKLNWNVKTCWFWNESGVTNSLAMSALNKKEQILQEIVKWKECRQFLSSFTLRHTCREFKVVGGRQLLHF